MDINEVIAKMQEIRATREAEIQARGMNGKVIDVKTLIDPLVNNETDKMTYLLIEEDEVTLPNGTVTVKTVERYYDENGKMVAGDQNLDQNALMLVDPNMETSLAEQVKGELIEFKEQLDLIEQGEMGLISLEELEKMREMVIAELDAELGLTQLDIKNLTIIDLSEEEIQKILDGELEVEAIKELDGNIEVDAQLDDVDIEKRKTQKDQLTEKDFSASAIIEGNTYVNENDTITSTLKVSDEGYVRFAVVQSNQLGDNPNNSKYTFVGIRKDGSAKILDSSILEAEMDDMGRENHELTTDGRVDDDQGNKETFKINDTFGFGLKDNGGKLEVSLMSTGRGRNGNESVGVPVRSYELNLNERKVQELNGRNRNKIDEGFDELEQNDNQEKIKTVEDIDGNPNTKSDTDWNSLVEELMEDKDVEAQFTSEEVREMIEKYWEKGDTEGQIKYKIESDANALENQRNNNRH